MPTIWMVVLHLYISHAVAEEIRDHRRVFGRKGGSILLDIKLNQSHQSGSETKPDVRWKHSDMYIVKNFKVQPNFTKMYKLFSNGSLMIHQGKATAHGNYVVEQYDGNGDCKFKQTIKLIMLEPVTKPTVSYFCNDNGTIVLTCSVEKGVQVVINWITEDCLSTNTLSTSPVMFTVPILMLAVTILNLKRWCKKTKPTSVEENQYIEMQVHSFSQPQEEATINTDASPINTDASHYDVQENHYVEMQGDLLSQPQEGATAGTDCDTSEYEFCRPMLTSNQRMITKVMDMDNNNIYS
ncbi:hypothetical protein DPEC_G00236830 [Dallia pectoralis]|uniref:Uncharacterized protein n=1 Tax=Dallia pectoralis TaxID=75939 RepID=A0ACC2FYB3_DALPE|nr:hypothetical protein DPEC_G00236830 [Dallia pectoralis]